MSDIRFGKKTLVFVEMSKDKGGEKLLAIVLAQAAHAVSTAERVGFNLDGVVFTAQLDDDRIAYRLEDS